MNVKPWFLTLWFLLCLTLAAAGQKSSPKSEPAASSRYQLVPAQVDSRVESWAVQASLLESHC
jgi:hypothetical protein